MGLEILEDCPEVRTVICAIGGGGLITGVGSAIKALRPDVKVLGAEPETAAPYALSLREGGPRRFADWQASFVDGAGGKSVTERMWQRMRPVVDGAITVTLDQTREAMRLIAEKSRTIAEGAGALSLAAALTGQAGEGPIVCVVSGGNIDLAKFCELVTADQRLRAPAGGLLHLRRARRLGLVEVVIFEDQVNRGRSSRGSRPREGPYC